MISIHISLFRLIKTYIQKDTSSFVYVALGDSTTEGIGATSMHRSYPGIINAYLTKRNKHVSFHNLGKNKAPTTQVIEEQLTKAIQLNPQLVTLSVGANDIRVKHFPWVFEKKLTTIIKTLKQETNATIVINSIPDFSHASVIPFLIRPLTHATIKHYNFVIEKVAKKEGIIFVDLFDQTRIFAKSYPEAIAEDKFHPSDFGYALWANTILNSLKTHAL